MKKKLRVVVVALVLLQVHFTYGQIATKLLQQFTVTYSGVTDTVDLMPISINSGGDVIVSGNQKMNSTQYDANSVSNGINSWVTSFNSGTGKAFITCSTSDASGNTYVAGGIRQSTSGIDFLVIKYNNVGTQQWVYYYNGPNNASDCASAILFQGGFVYVTGGSDGTSTDLDYATVKINASSGAQVWVSRYDYSSNIDVPSGITYNAASSSIFVTGSSGTSFTNYDFATIKYAISNGAQTSVMRTANTNALAQDQAYSMAQDNAHNIYVIGTTKNGTNYNVQLQKLDTSLNTVYTRTFDAHGYDDAGISLTLDSYANVYIAGTSHKSNGTKEFMVLKYDKNGNFKWNFLKQPTSGQDAEALRIKLMSDNEIFVGGNTGSGNNQDVILYCLDSMGVVAGEKRYNGTGNLKDKFMDLGIVSDKIYVSARTCTAASSTIDNNITIGYQYKAFPQTVASVGSGAAIQRYVNGEVIISFNKKVVKISTINNKDILFGQLSDFVQDSTCTKIELALDPHHDRGLSAKGLATRKIFFKLTEADSLSETRNGNYVKVPQFYCVLAVKLESWQNTTGAITPLNSIDPDINYAQLNNIYVLASPPNPPSTNDTYFSTDQGALHPITSYSLGHINADSAWAVVTGTSSVRLGILDSGIQPHSDLPSTISGYDFVANANLANGDLDNHGTGVAGTAGAIRNNNTGIAGVAGGDATSSQAGVTLYDCRVTQNGYVTDTWVSNAIQTSVQGANIGGFALHALNFGFYWAVSYNVNIWGHGVNQLTIDQMNFANRNGVAICSPKANFANIGTNVFPADWSDEIIMSVGSNGYNGEYCKSGTNCSNGSTQWGKIDFVAPGTTQLVKTISNGGGYMVEDGTSYATPHVSGAVSLMMGYRNSPSPNWNNLVHEDCEYILQKTATDCKDSANYLGEKMGYDSLTGWGRINVYKALKAINNNYYRIRHISESIGSTGTSGALLSPVYSGTLTWTNYPGVPTGTYSTEIWKRTTVINFTLLPSETIIDSWPLNKECYGTKFDSTYVDADRPYYGRIDQITSTSCTMSTYYYTIPTLSITMPYGLGALKSAFSLYTYDNSGTVGIKNNPDIVNYGNFKVFPNPHSAQFDVEFNSDFDGGLTYSLTNILGQVALTGSHKANFGKNNIKINSSALTNGVYILSIFNSNKELYRQKVIKE